MPNTIKASQERAESLVRQIGLVIDSAARIQLSLGEIISAAEHSIDRKETFGRRVRSFKSGSFTTFLDTQERQRIADAIEPLVEYRNRLDHDRWSSMMPSEDQTEIDVIGLGEKYLTSTTMRSIATLEAAFNRVSDACEYLAHLAETKRLGLREDAIEPRLCVQEIESAASSVGAEADASWRWIRYKYVAE